MFTRFRETGRRLQVSLVETRRQDGRIRHYHGAGLGSVAVPMSAADQAAFWTRLHQRLAALSNRVDAKAHAAILAAVHARIPMPTLDEQPAGTPENAKADARFWETMHGMQADRAAGHRGVAATLARRIAEDEAGAAKAAARLKVATDRVEKAERGEDVADVGRPMTGKELMKALGMTAADMRHAARDQGEAAVERRN